MATHKIQFTEAEEFFYRHAGYSHARDEPAWSGRARVAVLYAAAEDAFQRSSAYMEWEIEHPHWQASLYRDSDEYGREYLAGFGSVDFGKPADETDPHSEPYARVIRAELAMEAGL